MNASSGWRKATACFQRFLTAVTLIAAGGAANAASASPWIDQTNLFESGVGGYALYRIPGVVVSATGILLAYCEARRSGGDWAAIDLLARRSMDGGKTWQPPARIAEVQGPKPKNPIRKNPNPSETTYNNPVAIADSKGTIHFLFCLEYMRCFHQQSADDGLTWSKPQEITSAFEKFRSAYDWKVIATGPGHGIQLRGGRLVVPVWLSLGRGPNNHSPSVTSAIFSDDFGKSWRAGEIAMSESDIVPNANEAAVVELSDGHVLLNARNHSKEQCRAVAMSSDGGQHWTRPSIQKDLPEPICMAGMVRYTPEGETNRNYILFSQPSPSEIPAGKSGKRENLTVRLSRDNGQTWPVSKTLEPGPSAYSDLAVLPNGTIVCFYERANGGLSTYHVLTLARFNLAWLNEGQRPAEK